MSSAHQRTEALSADLARLADGLAKRRLNDAVGRLARAARVPTSNPVRLQMEQEAAHDAEQAQRLSSMASALRGSR